MTAEKFDKCLVAYNEGGDDYRYVLTRQQAEEIKQALADNEKRIDQIERLMINTIKNPKIETREQIEAYLQCIKDAKKVLQGIEGEDKDV